MALKLIVGLGNPGPQYTETRHNAGFWFIERLARQSNTPLRAERSFHAQLGKAHIAGQTVWLMQPDTFMNRSGVAVSAIASFYKIAAHEILVAHDELDLLPGVVKLKRGGGHAGHNGLKDIDARIGTLDFWRLRIGIGHPRSLGLPQEVVDFVLHRASREHQHAMDDAIDKALGVTDLLVQEQFDAAMMKLHAAS